MLGMARWSPLLAIPLLLGADVDAGEWRGSIRLATDYAYRGYSKSRGNPVIQGRIDYEHESGGFAGFGISNVSFDDKGAASRANVEMNPYAGWAWRFSDDWRGDLTASYYTYDGEVFSQTVDFAEFSFAAHYKDMLSARISFAPDAFRQRANTLNYELQWRHDVMDNVRVSLGLGFHQAGRLFHHDYFHWNAGITWFATRNLSLDLRYIDSELVQEPPEPFTFYPRIIDFPLMFSLTAGF